MQIWIIHQNAYAPSHSASTRHFELGRELVRRGHEVLIVASSFYHKGREETRLQRAESWKQETIDGVRYLWLRTPGYEGNGIARLWNMLVYTFRVWRMTGLSEEPRPDVIVGSSPHLFSPWAAMRLAQRYNKPFVLEIRDVWPAVPVEIGALSSWHPLVRLWRWLEKTYYGRAERVISILPFADRHIEESIGRSDHAVWIPNGSPLDPVTEPNNSDAPLTFMYAGAHSLYSGLDVVLDAAEILKNEGWGDRVRIRLVGDGPEKARLVASVRQRGLEMITFDPPVPKTQVFERLQEADAFLLVYKDAPLMKWGLCPNKLYDYMAAARPVIFGMAAPNNPVRESNAGLTVKPQEPVALAEGIKQLVQTPWRERVTMGRRGRAYVQEHHNFSLLGEKLEQVLREVVQQHRERRPAPARNLRVVSNSAAAVPALAPHRRRCQHFVKPYQPIVIIGAPRSGTNMLRDVLASLPGVCTWPCDEINYIWRHGNAARLDDEFLPEQATPRVEAYIRRAFESLARREGASWVVEKTCANSLRVGFVDQIVPDAKYVFLVRDGRDAVASAMRRWTAPMDLSYVLKKGRYVPPSDLPRYALCYASNRLGRWFSPERRLASWGPRFRGMRELLAERSLAEVCATQWERCVAEARKGLAALESSRVIDVKYEQFVAQPCRELQRLVDFLEMDASIALQRSATNEVSDRNVGKWHSALDEETLARIAPIIDSQLIELGYQPCCADAIVAKAA